VYNLKCHSSSFGSYAHLLFCQKSTEIQSLNVVAKNTPTLSFAFAPTVSSAGHVCKREMFYLFPLVTRFLNWNSSFVCVCVCVCGCFRLCNYVHFSIQGLFPYWKCAARQIDLFLIKMLGVLSASWGPELSDCLYFCMPDWSRPKTIEDHLNPDQF